MPATKGKHWSAKESRRGHNAIDADGNPTDPDDVARNELVVQWSGLPAWVVERWANHSAVQALGRDDAIQAGMLGLLRAAELWDEGRGVKFCTYAVVWIRQAICRATPGAFNVHVPARPRFPANARLARACVPLGDLQGDPPDRRAGPEGEALRAEVGDRLHGLLRHLDARSRDVLLRRAAGEKLREVAERLGVTRERVRQIEGKALRKLRLVAREGRA